MEIARYLKSGSHFEELDKRVFNEWENDEIPTEVAIYKFRRNNQLPPSVHIDEGEFELWLNSLGYYNKDTQHRMPVGCYILY